MYIQNAMNFNNNVSLSINKLGNNLLLTDGLKSLSKIQTPNKPLLVTYTNAVDNVQLYLDIDGVFADFEGYIEEVAGKKMTEISSKELWSRIIPGLVNTPESPFLNFKLLPGAFDLYHDLRDLKPIFLSSTGFKHDIETHRLVEKQKTKWVKENLDKDAKVICVSASRYKSIFAANNSILVDDRTQSTDNWSKHGTSVLYTKETTSKEILDLHKSKSKEFWF